MSRHIRFEGIENFRDFGDYAAGGRRLKGGLLYRSASHAKASDADLEQLAGLGLSVIVDLRRRNERDRDPSRRWPGFAAQVVESDIGQETADEWQAFVARADLTPASFRGYMLDYYEAAPHEPRHLDLYTRYFRALAETEGPVLVHCSAGKDRTGIACALTHHIAGVHYDDLMADYLLTNDPVRLANRAPTVIAAIREMTGKTASEAGVHVAMRVEPEYLARAFGVMRERHGSIDGYLEEALGLGGELRERLHARLLA
jgi:protein tyrosine/serine phosphatase